MDSRIQKIVERWYLSEPALFQVYCTHNLEQNTAMSCPFRCGKGRIEFNADIIKDVSLEKLELYLKSEIIRILLKHPYERQPNGCKHKSTSMGSNLVLSDNYDFCAINLPKPADFGLLGSESFEWYSLRMEEYYRNSDKEEQEKPSKLETCNSDLDNQCNPNNDDSSEMNPSLNKNSQGNSNLQDKDGLEIQIPDGTLMTISPSGAKASDYKCDNFPSCRDSGNSESTEHTIEKRRFNSDLANEDLSSLWEEDSVQQCAIDVAIDEIEANHAWGSLAGRVAQQIIANTKAKIDYRKVLAGFRASILSSKRHLTRMRPNRRSGFDNMGSIRRFDTNLLVAVDVSGSVSNQVLSHFYSIINKAFKYGVEHIDTIQFDTELKDVQTLEKAQKEIHILGRGGTSFQPIFDFIGKHPEYDGLIIFTDGGAPEPKAPKGMRCKVVWVLNDKGNYESSKSWMRKTGRSCTMEL